MSAGPFIDDLNVDDEIPVLRKKPTNVQLFRFSAVTWNAHRVHYDKDYAAREGYRDVLVQAHLHGCFLAELVTRWMGPAGTLEGFGWQNRGAAYPGDELVCTGRIREVRRDDERVELELEERNQDDELCAPGWATVHLPRRQGPHESSLR